MTFLYIKKNIDSSIEKQKQYLYLYLFIYIFLYFKYF